MEFTMQQISAEASRLLTRSIYCDGCGAKVKLGEELYQHSRCCKPLRDFALLGLQDEAEEARKVAIKEEQAAMKAARKARKAERTKIAENAEKLKAAVKAGAPHGSYLDRDLSEGDPDGPK